MTALTQYPGLAFGLALLWAALACLLPLVRMRRRPPCLFALVVCGVPVLGWLTLICGPGFGCWSGRRWKACAAAAVRTARPERGANSGVRPVYARCTPRAPGSQRKSLRLLAFSHRPHRPVTGPQRPPD